MVRRSPSTRTLETYPKIRKEVKEELKNYFKCDGLAKVIEDLETKDIHGYGLGHLDEKCCEGTFMETLVKKTC